MGCSAQLKYNKLIINGEILDMKGVKNMEGDNTEIKQD